MWEISFQVKHYTWWLLISPQNSRQEDCASWHLKRELKISNSLSKTGSKWCSAFYNIDIDGGRKTVEAGCQLGLWREVGMLSQRDLGHSLYVHSSTNLCLHGFSHLLYTVCDDSPSEVDAPNCLFSLSLRNTCQDVLSFISLSLLPCTPWLLHHLLLSFYRVRDPRGIWDCLMPLPPRAKSRQSV